MPAFKDKKRNSWYTAFYYTDWTGKRRKKLKRGFATKKEAQDWEKNFILEKSASLDMTFGDFYKRYEAEMPAIFNHAVKYYELSKNPAVIAGPLGQQHADEMKFWTKDEYMQFIPSMANKTYSYIAFELLYWCGIRIGELMVLTPSDFDFDKNKLAIYG